MQNVLLLGSQGFMGNFLADKLNKCGLDVIRFDKAEVASDKQEAGYRYICGDFTTEYDYKSLFNEFSIDTIYHLISTTVPDFKTETIIDEIKENVFPTLSLLEAMRKSDIKKMVFVSSGGTVYGESNGIAHKPDKKLQPICSYGIYKSMIESYFHLYNKYYDIDYSIARISNPYGEYFQKNRTQGLIPILINRLYNNEPINLYGDTKRDYIYIDDVIEALYKIGVYNGPMKIFNIGSGVAYTLSQIVEKIENTTGKRFVEITRLPIRKCDVLENVLDISETMKELNWRPRHDIDTGILELLKSEQFLTK